MKHRKASMICAGVDVSKARLDIAVHGCPDRLQVENDAAGFPHLLDWLKARGVRRVGLEASGGYERAIAACLRAEGLQVVLHQPIEVRLFARLKRIKAKSDPIDAAVIAHATAALDAVRAAADPRLAALAERLTVYEQAAALTAQLKTAREHVADEDLRSGLEAQLATLAAWKKTLAASLFAAIKAEADLRRRWRLLQSLPGVGPLIAATLIVRMPELGAMERGQAAALIGVAPFDRDSGPLKGARFIWGGRARPRRFLYLAALAAKRFDPAFKAFAQRLIANGKKPKVAIVAVMRKLIEAANIVLARGTPWTTAP